MPTTKKATKQKAAKQPRKASPTKGKRAGAAALPSALPIATISQPQVFMIDTANEKYKAVLMYLMKDEANIDAVYHLIHR